MTRPDGRVARDEWRDHLGSTNLVHAGHHHRDHERTGELSITEEEVEREKKELPTGWGRFGTALERLIELSEAEESLVATCVALNPDYHHTVGGLPGNALNLATVAQEASGATNVVVACTDRRIVLVFTGLGGAPRSHAALPFDGTSIVERDKKSFVLQHAGTQLKFRGAAKRPAARLLDALSARLPT